MKDANNRTRKVENLL